MDIAKLRAWWSHRQGLDGSLLGKSPAFVLEQAGWARSVGGAGPYLTLFARAGTLREEAEAAVARTEIYEIPAARGCTYVVPAGDFAVALKVGQNFAGADMRVAVKLGVTDAEIEKLCRAVHKALLRGAMDPDGIREATGQASRHLGDEGKKKGLTTTLPLALGRMQARGEIRRVPVNGRLDQQRYKYALWDPSPLASYRGSSEEALLELARRYFRWVGPATLGEFRWFSGSPARATKEAAGALGLVPIEPGHDRLLLPEDVERYRAFRIPPRPQYVLVSSLDSLSAARRDVTTLLEAGDSSRKVWLEKAFGTLGGLSDLPDHAIFDRGRLVGLWEYDPESLSIVWASFGDRDKAIEAAVKHCEKFVRDELGDARSFSLDSAKSRTPKIEALRSMK